MAQVHFQSNSKIILLVVFIWVILIGIIIKSSHHTTRIVAFANNVYFRNSNNSTTDSKPDIINTKSQDEDNNNTTTYDLIFNTECIHNYHTTCTLQHAQNILFTKSSIISHQNMEYMHNLKYLIIGSHGGVQIDIISYLYYKLKIPIKNIYNHCYGMYCYLMNNEYPFRNQKRDKILRSIVKDIKWCCRNQSDQFLTNITYIQSWQQRFEQGLKLSFPEIVNTKFDVIICSFPGVQCIKYLPFAKLIIFRFAHRYDHHLCSANNNRFKWIKILNIIAQNCLHNNVIFTVTNIYDYFYLKHTIHFEDENIPYLWPNFAQHFINELGINHTVEAHKNQVFIYPESQGKFDDLCVVDILNISRIKISLQKHNGISLLTLKNEYKKYMYNQLKINRMVTGIVIIPYAVHTAKWIEFYSIGVQLFFPTLRLWMELNNKCEVIHDRQYCNKPTWPLNETLTKEFMNLYVKYSECCGTQPYTNNNHNQMVWLSFADWYNDKIFKYVIFYGDEHDLRQKLIKYNEELMNDGNNKVMDKRMKQINEWENMSDLFKDKISNMIWNSHRKFPDNNCIPKAIDLTNIIIQSDSTT